MPSLSFLSLAQTEIVTQHTKPISLPLSHTLKGEGAVTVDLRPTLDWCARSSLRPIPLLFPSPFDNVRAFNWIRCGNSALSLCVKDSQDFECMTHTSNPSLTVPQQQVIRLGTTPSALYHECISCRKAVGRHAIRIVTVNTTQLGHRK